MGEFPRRGPRSAKQSLQPALLVFHCEVHSPRSTNCAFDSRTALFRRLLKRLFPLRRCDTVPWHVNVGLCCSMRKLRKQKAPDAVCRVAAIKRFVAQVPDETHTSKQRLHVTARYIFHPWRPQLFCFFQGWEIEQGCGRTQIWLIVRSSRNSSML